MSWSLEPDKLELSEMVSRSLSLLQEHEPLEGYYGCFSGGKDSIVIKQLALEAGVEVLWHYNVTTIDPPELTKYIKEFHPDVRWERSKHKNFFKRMEKKGFPTRRNRWCCDEFKESTSPQGAVLILGIRQEESAARAKRWSDVQTHWKTGGKTVQPIVQWSSDEVWGFIRDRALSYCSLYDEGFHRLGCVGCPMAGSRGRKIGFERWPIFERLWRRTFRRYWDRKTGTIQRDGRQWFGDVFFTSWEQMFDWGLSDRPLPEKRDSPQMSLFEDD